MILEITISNDYQKIAIEEFNKLYFGNNIGRVERFIFEILNFVCKKVRIIDIWT